MEDSIVQAEVTNRADSVDGDKERTSVTLTIKSNAQGFSGNITRNCPKADADGYKLRQVFDITVSEK